MVAAAGLFSRCDASEEDAGKVQQIAIEEEGKVQQMAKKRSHSRWRRRAGCRWWWWWGLGAHWARRPRRRAPCWAQARDRPGGGHAASGHFRRRVQVA